MFVVLVMLGLLGMTGWRDDVVVIMMVITVFFLRIVITCYWYMWYPCPSFKNWISLLPSYANNGWEVSYSTVIFTMQLRQIRMDPLGFLRFWATIRSVQFTICTAWRASNVWSKLRKWKRECRSLVAKHCEIEGASARESAKIWIQSFTFRMGISCQIAFPCWFCKCQKSLVGQCQSAPWILWSQ